MEKVGILLILAVLLKQDSTDETGIGIITASNDDRKHQYIDLREGDNWCWLHNEWEDVRIVNSRNRRKEDSDSTEAVSLNN
mgnify:FL=1|tara:strand:- start:13 stop:255 length:243 start_codon:yes stop_codon:yes gene_type:complete